MEKLSLGNEKVNHSNPVFIGDTIYATSKIINKTISKKSKRKGKVVIYTQAFNQNKKEVISFYRTILVPTK